MKMLIGNTLNQFREYRIQTGTVEKIRQNLIFSSPEFPFIHPYWYPHAGLQHDHFYQSPSLILQYSYTTYPHGSIFHSASLSGSLVPINTL